MYRNKVFLADLPLGVKCCPHCHGCGCGHLPPPPLPCGCCPPAYPLPCGCRPEWPKEDYLPEGVQPQPPRPKPKPPACAAVYILRDSWHLPPQAEIISSSAEIAGWETVWQYGCRMLKVRYCLQFCWRECRHIRRTRLENCATLPWPQGACPGDLLMLVCTPPQLRGCGCGVVEVVTQLKISW